MHRSIVKSAFAAALLAMSTAPAVSEVPGELSCGDTISADTVLDRDLLDCPNHGLVIGADGVTLDLNGHVIDGDGAPAAGCRPRRELCDVGVANEEHDGVTVSNGSVREFATGVLVGGARDTRVLGIATSGNRFFGIVIGGSSRSLVRDSSGDGSPEPDGDGLGVFGSDHVRIVDSAFRRNAQLGIHVVDSTGILMRGNVISHNTDMGILLEGNRNEVRGNRCVANGACLVVAPGSRNVVAGNRISRGGEGIAIEKGRGNRVVGNVVARTRTEGIRLGLNEPPIGGAGTVVRGNRVTRSGGDAFVVTKNDHHSVLSRNVAIAAGTDGFDVASRSARLTRNRAVRNADLGIEAVRGVIDGGGNVARRNGDRRGCTNIGC